MAYNGKDTSNKESNENETYYGYDLYPDRRRNTDISWSDRLVGRYSTAERDKYNCEWRVIKALKTHPLVRILVNALESSGCPFDIARNISCEVCDEKVTGGYDVEWNQIVICQNNYKSSHFPEITLVHELIHMFDYCTKEVDFKNNEHLACSEIRAANISHCSFLSSFFLGQSTLFDIKKSHQYCVKMKAAQSLMVARNMDFDTALKHVLRVFDKCYNDLEPVGRRVRRTSNEPYMAYRDSIHYGYGKPILNDTVD